MKTKDPVVCQATQLALDIANEATGVTVLENCGARCVFIHSPDCPDFCDYACGVFAHTDEDGVVIEVEYG